MYSTEIGELAQKDQIKDGYRRSNKNDAARQILSQYGRQHALGMRLQTIEALSKVKGVIVAEDSGMQMPAFSGHSTPRRVLKGLMKNTSTLTELCPTLNIHYSDMMQVVFVTERGAAGFHFVTPPLLRPGVNSLPFLPAPYDTGPWPGCGAGRVFYFPR